MPGQDDEERRREEERLRELRRMREAEAEKRRRDEDATRSSVCPHGYVRGKCPDGC